MEMMLQEMLCYDVSIEIDMASNRKCAQVWWMRKQANQREELTVMKMMKKTARQRQVYQSSIQMYTRIAYILNTEYQK